MSNRFLDRFRSHNENEEQKEQTGSTNLQKVFESQKRLEENSCKTILFSSPIISHGELGVIFPNTINIIQGKKGVHKSRITENFCALLLCNILGKTFLGFKKNATARFSVLYIDTERNQTEQFPSAIQKIKRLAGYEIEEKPPNFGFISLIDIERNERFETTREYLEHFRESNPQQHLFIVFDVVTDCIENFNNVAESMKFVDMLNKTINDHNVTFLCVIHENPSAGNDKGRGHLGTELNNKASQVMQIGFEKDSKGNDTDLIRLKCLHARSTKKLDPIYLEYSEEAKGLVLASSDFVAERLAQKKGKATLPEVQKWLEENLGDGLTKEHLQNNLTNYFECSKRTIEERLSELVENGFLSKEKRGREVYYKLTVPF
jgi:DNA-binding transcriptional ArsR family regulator